MLRRRGIGGVLGAAIGTVVGIGYAALMIFGLRTWWLAAIRTPFLHLYLTPRTLLFGSLAGIAVSLAVIYWSLARGWARPRRALLSRQSGELAGAASRPARRMRLLAIVAIIGAVITAAAGSGLGDMAAALAFFGSGALVLVGLLAATGGALGAAHMDRASRPAWRGSAWLAFAMPPEPGSQHALGWADRLGQFSDHRDDEPFPP